MSVETRTNRDAAVSPVVGVMLMLVVTIILAAVVATFATGFGGDLEQTPAVKFDVAGVDNGSLVFMHKGGDTLATNDMRVFLSLAGDELTSRIYSTSSQDLAHYLSPAKSAVSVGGTFQLKGLDYGAGTYMHYRVIDFKTGNVITDSSFMMPEGVRSYFYDAEPNEVSIAYSRMNMMYPDTISLHLDNPAERSVVFTVDCYNSSKNMAYPGTNALESAVVTITKSGSPDVTISYDGSAYGFPFEFTKSGTYTVTAKVNGKSSSKNSGSGYDPSNHTTWKSSGSLSVTVV